MNVRAPFRLRFRITLVHNKAAVDQRERVSKIAGLPHCRCCVLLGPTEQVGQGETWSQRSTTLAQKDRR